MDPNQRTSGALLGTSSFTFIFLSIHLQTHGRVLSLVNSATFERTNSLGLVLGLMRRYGANWKQIERMRILRNC